MTPLNVINLGFSIVRKTSFASNQVLYSYVSISTKLISPSITRLKTKSVTSVGVIISHHSQIIVIRQGKIISSVLQEIALTVVFSKGRHYKTRCVFSRSREKCKRNAHWCRNIHNHHIGQTNNHLFSRNHFEFSGMKV